MPLLWAAQASALVIYRFGGEDLEPPPEAGEPGVVFVQLAWEDLNTDASGRALDVDFTDGVIGPLRRNPNVNIAPHVKDNGGFIIQEASSFQVWDGDPETVWEATPYLCAEREAYSQQCAEGFGSLGTTNINLGGNYQLDRVRVVSGLNDAGKTVQAVRVFVGPEEPPGRPSHWLAPPYTPPLVEVRDNRKQLLDIFLPPHNEVGFLQVTVGEHADPWEVHDIQVFAKGFVQRATYTSDIIDFGKPMAWGELRWEGLREERAKVSVNTRSGSDDTPLRYWRFTGRGSDRAEVAPDAYSKLKPGEKAGTSHDQANWDFWSSYEFENGAGAQVVSLSPRRYLQLQVDFLPQAEDGGHVRFLELRASAPLASNLVGEVWPVEAAVGRQTDFTYVLRPTIGPTDTGFDLIEIRSVSLLSAVRRVTVGDVPVEFTAVVSEPNRASVRIPPMGPAESGALVNVEFEATVLRYGAGFDVRVANSEQPLEVPQGVNPGDATGQYEGNTASVATNAGTDLVRIRLPTPVVTPNGDGVNDEVAIAFDILEITRQAQIQVEIRNLAGRRVRLLHDGPAGVGSYERRWDGRDDDRQLLPPGVYLVHVSADTDRDRVRRTRVLQLAY